MIAAPAMTEQTFTPYTPPNLVYVQPGAPMQMQPVAVPQTLQPISQTPENPVSQTPAQPVSPTPAPPAQSDHPYHQAIASNDLHDKSGTVTCFGPSPEQNAVAAMPVAATATQVAVMHTAAGQTPVAAAAVPIVSIPQPATERWKNSVAPHADDDGGDGSTQ
jgi:hypothetical protein